MRYPNRLLLIVIISALCVGSASAQTFRSADPVIRRMWQVGMEQSQTEALAQVLIDSVGPRLSGSPGFQSSVEWLERKYREWGVTVRRERYGTWRGWQQGAVHMAMIAPRVQKLEVEILAWSLAPAAAPSKVMSSSSLSWQTPPPHGVGSDGPWQVRARRPRRSCVARRRSWSVTHARQR